MKKCKITLIAILLLLTLFTGCNNNKETVNNDKQNKELYDAYINGGGNLSYEEWLCNISNGQLNTFTIVFNTNGGTIIDDQIVNLGDKIVKPNDPIKDGYTFLGWYYNDEEWSFSENIVNKDITLEASWIINDFSFILKNDDTYELTSVNLKDANIVVPSIFLDKPVTSIGEKAFYNCQTLISISIPNSITSIYAYAFSNCISLKSISLSTNLSYIGEYAFYGCSRLSSINIPVSVTYIGKDAFSNCCDLTIYCEAKSKPDGFENAWNGNSEVIWNYIAGSADLPFC